MLKISHRDEMHVYRTAIAADKKNLLSQFRHVAAEFAATKRKEREGEHSKSIWTGDVTREHDTLYGFYLPRSTRVVIDWCYSAAPWHLAATSHG